jgi:hypothetical protein
MKVIRHRFNIWVDVPAVYGDGWSKYPDYSAGEVGRMLRRALHDRFELKAVVEHADSVTVDEQEPPVDHRLVGR